MSLSKYCLKDLTIYFHLMTDFLWVHPVKGTSPKYSFGWVSAFGGPTVMNSAKQINFLPIFKVFQNGRIYIFGWHTISWALTALAVKKFFAVFWEMRSTSETAAAPCLYFREGEIKAELWPWVRSHRQLVAEACVILSAPLSPYQI